MWEQLIGMGSKLLGGFMNQNAQENANAANQALQQTQMAYQHQANTHGVRWRVEDAIAAGLHPLAAMGMSPAQGFSASVGHQSPETGLGSALGDMGQDITRAINATRTQNERGQAFVDAARSLATERGNLQNELLKLQIRRLEQTMNPPAPGQVDVKPAEDTTRGSNPSQQPGDIPSVDYERTSTGWQPVPGKISKERQEDDFIASTLWKIKNYLQPNWAADRRVPPNVPLAPGKMWQWEGSQFEWQQVDAPAYRRSGPSHHYEGYGPTSVFERNLAHRARRR